jgi:hypothetical protein
MFDYAFHPTEKTLLEMLVCHGFFMKEYWRKSTCTVVSNNIYIRIGEKLHLLAK